MGDFILASQDVYLYGVFQLGKRELHIKKGDFKKLRFSLGVVDNVSKAFLRRRCKEGGEGGRVN